jgi:hypothetical protein
VSDDTAADEKATRRLLAPEPELEPTMPAASQAAASDPLFGVTFCGRYRVLDLVGRGGMGVVYRVEHTEIRKLLAMKVLPGPLGSDRDVVARFKREAQLASRLTHPNSVQVFDYGTCQGLTFLIMEYVHGRDLAQVLDEDGPMSVERAARILIQVCGSLAEAHGLGIIHRDVKPANVMLARTRDGSDFAKVLDFGLAKLRGSQELNGLTGGGQLVGTPNYMAPEQILGRPVDPRTDVYAVGAILYRAVVGKAPFGGAPAMEIFRRHVEEPPEPPHLRAPERGIPELASAVILRAMEKDPARRYQRIEELREALVELAGGPQQAAIGVLLDVREMVKRNESVTTAVEVETPEPPARGEAAGSQSSKGRSIATRDELGRYRTRLVRQRRLQAAGSVAALALLVAGGWWGYRAAFGGPAAFDGEEREPNNEPAQANAVPFGARVHGVIGRRLAPDRGDVDHYRIVVPPGTTAVAVRTSGVPNIPLCTTITAEGGRSPAARFCPGAAELPVREGAVPLGPGVYDVEIGQDTASEALAGLPILESISDRYTLQLGPAER